MAAESDDVANRMLRLLREQIDDLDQVQLLLLLARYRRSLSLHDLAETAGIPVETAAGALAALCRLKLVVPEEEAGCPAYLYKPADAAVIPIVERLSATYESDPVPIIRLMTAKSIERVRAAALLTFADAFVLRRRRDG